MSGVQEICAVCGECGRVIRTKMRRTPIGNFIVSDDRTNRDGEPCPDSGNEPVFAWEPAK